MIPDTLVFINFSGMIPELLTNILHNSL